MIFHKKRMENSIIRKGKLLYCRIKGISAEGNI